MADTLRNPNDIKYTGHNTNKPKKWIPITRRVKKTALRRKPGPVKLNPEYTEWEEKQKARINKLKFKRLLKKKSYQ